MAPASRKQADREVARESDANELSGTAPYGHANVQSSDADFDRNRDGLYGGLPDAREKGAAGGKAKTPQPTKKQAASNVVSRKPTK